MPRSGSSSSTISERGRIIRKSFPGEAGICNIYITAQYAACHPPGGFSIATEFELTISGTGKDLLDAVALLADHNINLDTIATARVGDKYVIKFLTACEEECRRTFIKSDLPFTERKVLVLDVINRPGQWLRAARCLLDAGIELNTSYLLRQEGNKLRFVFGVNDYEKAKRLAGQITECSLD